MPTLTANPNKELDQAVEALVVVLYMFGPVLGMVVWVMGFMTAGLFQKKGSEKDKIMSALSEAPNEMMKRLEKM